MSENITREQAQAAFDAVKARYAIYFEPIDLGDGKPPLSPTYTAEQGPTLHEPGVLANGWAIAWEEGPDEWVYSVSGGGSTEEERVLMAEANAEFDANVVVDEPAPTKMPAGVFVEPVNHVTLGLYPA